MKGRSTLESLKSYRWFIVSSLSLLVTLCSFFLALGLRFEFEFADFFREEYIFIHPLLLLLFRHAAYMYWRVNGRSWRHTSLPELELLIRAHLASSVVFAASIFAFRIEGFPRSVIVIEFIVSLGLSLGLRYLARVAADRFASRLSTSSLGANREVIVVGGGESGHLVVKTLLLQQRFSYTPVAVLDDSERLIKTSIHGVEVVGSTDHLDALLASNKRISAVIIAIPSLARSRFKELSKVCERHDVAVKKLQSFEDIACLDAQEDNRRRDIEGMLDRQTNIAFEDEIRAKLAGKRVLVTGAGGSIGAELVRQIAGFDPTSIILVDNSEFNLFEIDRELHTDFRNVNVRPRLINVGDKRRTASLLREERPEIIFHAAAYKHVPLLETNAYAAFVNNICTTRDLLLAASTSDVERFILISTDKAVDPESVMGATKKICEMIVRELLAHSNGVSTSIVRFGNVINSTGSVIPIFKKQIAAGGPITVTHPEIERYFMSINEAVRLVLAAGTLGEPGRTYVLNMGKRVKIVEVARKMLALYGRRDIEIKFTGLRLGEKLTEELVSSNERRVPSRLEKVEQVERLEDVPADVLGWIQSVESRLPSLTERDLRREILEMAAQDNFQRAAREVATL